MLWAAVKPRSPARMPVHLLKPRVGLAVFRLTDILYRIAANVGGGEYEMAHGKSPE